MWLRVAISCIPERIRAIGGLSWPLVVFRSLWGPWPPLVQKQDRPLVLGRIFVGFFNSVYNKLPQWQDLMGEGVHRQEDPLPIPSASTVRCHMLQVEVASNLLDLPWSCFRSGLSSFSWNWPFLSHSRSLCILSQGKSHSVWQSVKTTLWSLNFLLDPAWIIIYNKTSGLLSWELCRSNDIILWI